MKSLFLRLFLTAFWVGHTSASLVDEVAKILPFSNDHQSINALLNNFKPQPSSSLEILKSHTSYRFDEDGSYKATRYSLIYIANEDGLNDISQLSFPYRPWYESRPKVRARIYNQGKFSTFDTSKISESVLKQEGLIYAETKILHLPLENLYVGSILELETTIDQHRPALEVGSSLIDPFYPSNFTHFLRLEVTHPDQAMFKTGIEGPPVKPTVHFQEVNSGQLTQVFEYSELKPFPYQINASLPDEFQIPTLVVSTANNWQAISNQYEMAVNEQIVKLSTEHILGLINDQGSRADVIQRVVKFMNDNIRYISNDLGQTTLLPDAPTDILLRGYGDCKDQSTLMVAMLRKLGIDANVALVSTFSPVPEDYPGISPFDHIIVYLPDDEIWLDPTSQSTDITKLPSMVQNRPALIVRSGTSSIVFTPQSTHETNQFVRRIDIHYVDNNIGASVEDTREYRGNIYELMFPQEGQLLEQQKEQLSLYARSTLAAVPGEVNVTIDDSASTAKVKGTSTDAQAYDLTRFGFSPTINGTQVLEFIPLQFKSGYEQMKQQIAAANASAASGFERDNKPFYVGLLSTNRVVERHHVPHYMNWVSTPSRINIDGPVVRYSRESVIENNILTVTTEAVVKKNTVSPQEVKVEQKNFNEFSKTVVQRANLKPTARILIEEGKAQEGFAYHRSLIASEPLNPMHVIRFSDDLESLGLKSAAFTHLQNYRERYSESAMFQNELGVNQLIGTFGEYRGYGSDLKAASIYFQKALKLDQNDIYSLYGLAFSIIGRHGSVTFEQLEYLITQIENALNSYRENAAVSPGLYTSNNSAKTIMSLVNFAAKAYLLTGNPDGAITLLTSWGLGDDHSKQIIVAAEMLRNGPDSARNVVAAIGVANIERVLVGAQSVLTALGFYQTAIELQGPDMSQNTIYQTATLAVNGDACIQKLNPSERQVWDLFYNPDVSSVKRSSYPPALSVLPKISPFDASSEPKLLIDDTVRETTKCLPVRVVYDQPPLLIADAAEEVTLLYRSDDQLILIGTTRNSREVARVFKILLDNGHISQAKELLQLVLAGGGKQTQKVWSRLAVFHLANEQEIDDKYLPFYGALLDAVARNRSDLAVKTLAKPPLVFTSSRHLRTLDRLMTRVIPLAREDEAIALDMKVFEESDQLHLDWSRSLRFLSKDLKDAARFKVRIAEYMNAFGNEETAPLFRMQIELMFLEENYDDLISKTSQAIASGLIGIYDVNEIAYRLFQSNTHLAEALELMQHPKLTLASPGYAISHTLACLLAVNGKLTEAYKTLRNTKTFPMRVVETDLIVLALIAQSLGEDAYLKNLAETLAGSDSTDTREVAERFM